jgi:taurine dioxygenase
MRPNSLAIHPLNDAVGAEIDLDLSQPHEDWVYREIRQAIVAHGVVFFRDQTLDSEQYAKFARHFGKTIVPTSDIIPALDGSLEIAEVRKEPEQTRNIGGSWHTDQAFRPAPYWGTMLLAREVPDFGGDTLFISMAAVYKALSDGLKQTLDGLRAVHSNARVQAKMTDGKPAQPEAIHPVIARHPSDGHRFLYVNPGYTVRFDGWTEQESQPLLDYLFRFAQRPEFACRWRWREGSLAFWDNYQTWHYATNDYQGERRVMHRIVVESDPFS